MAALQELPETSTGNPMTHDGWRGGMYFLKRMIHSNPWLERSGDKDGTIMSIILLLSR
jgi:hypothetical protein